MFFIFIDTSEPYVDWIDRSRFYVDDFAFHRHIAKTWLTPLKSSAAAHQHIWRFHRAPFFEFGWSSAHC